MTGAELTSRQRRIAAWALLGLLAAIVAWVMTSLIGLMSQAREELREVRERDALQRTVISWPVARSRESGDAERRYLPGEEAQSRLKSHLTETSNRLQIVLVTATPTPTEDSGTFERMDVEVRGDPAGLSAWIAALENGAPAIRFENWMIAPADEAGLLAFRGTAVTVRTP